MMIFINYYLSLSYPSFLFPICTKNGCIILSKIRRGSCLHKSNLHEGYEIISVNGLPCYGLSIDQVEDLFTDSIDIITIIADDPMDTQRRRLVLEL